MYCRRLDICRILLRQGARLDHVSVFGWTALVYLFEGIRAGPGMRDNIRMMDFLELLDDDKDVLDLHICDTNGEDALQHAARASTGDMLLWLLRYGSALDRYGEDPWQAEENPMRLAIINGNMSAFQALLPYYPGGIDVEDEVGFTMLDYAARRGHRNMVRYLLDLGAKATLPEYSMTGEGTIRIEGDVDPDEYVEWTRDSYFVYLSVLEEKNMIVVRKEEDDSERYVDLYWDAKEDAGQYHLGYHED
jgi:ankyrin repeat protein